MSQGKWQDGQNRTKAHTPAHKREGGRRDRGLATATGGKGERMEEGDVRPAKSRVGGEGLNIWRRGKFRATASDVAPSQEKKKNI